MEIQLKHGFKTKVDDEMYPFFSSLKWNLLRGRGKPYVRHNLYFPKEKKLFDVFMHHMVIGRPLNRMVIDHINGDTLDNRKINLRIVSHRDNSSNTKLLRHGKKTSKYTGVSKQKNKWISVIQINGVLKYLGRFNSEEDAKASYENAKREVL